MSTSRVTTVIITGPAVSQLRPRVAVWVNEGHAEPGIPFPWASQIDSISTRVEMMKLARLVHSRSQFSPIVWYHQVVDHWTIAPGLSLLSFLQPFSSSIQLSFAMSDNIDIGIIEIVDTVRADLIASKLLGDKALSSLVHLDAAHIKVAFYQAYQEIRALSSEPSHEIAALVFVEQLGPSWTADDLGNGQFPLDGDEE